MMMGDACRSWAGYIYQSSSQVEHAAVEDKNLQNE